MLHIRLIVVLIVHLEVVRVHILHRGLDLLLVLHLRLHGEQILVLVRYPILVLVVGVYHDLALLCHYLVIHLELGHFVSVDVVVSLLNLVQLSLLGNFRFDFLTLNLLDELVLLDHLGNLDVPQAGWRHRGWLVHLLHQFLFIEAILLTIVDHLSNLRHLVGRLGPLSLIVVHLILVLSLQKLHGALLDLLFL